MASGDSYSVELSFVNAGTQIWSSSNLSLQADPDIWNMPAVQLPSGQTVPPYSIATFVFDVVAPPASFGKQPFRWRLYLSGSQISASPQLDIDVAAGYHDAQMVSQVVAASYVGGDEDVATVTMLNTGNKTWENGPGTTYQLSALSPWDNDTWRYPRVNLPAGATVQPGETLQFEFDIKAPYRAGTYNFHWVMRLVGQQVFGYTDLLQIPVSFHEVRAVRFVPAVWINGIPRDKSFIKKYHKPETRAFVQQDLMELRDYSGITAVMIALSVFDGFDWPQPTAAQLRNLTDFINDADDLGMRVVVAFGNPAQVPQSEEAANCEPYCMVGGHGPGDVINCWNGTCTTIFWQIPEFPSNVVELSRQFFEHLLDALHTDVDNLDAVAYLLINGAPHQAFMVEFPWRDGYPYNEQVKTYWNTIFPFIHGYTKIPVAMNYVGGQTWQNDPYTYWDDIATDLDLDSVDLIDFTYWWDIDMDEVLNRLGPVHAAKAFPTDFKLGAPGAPSDRSAEMQRIFTEVRDRDMPGWTYWGYRPVLPNSAPLREAATSPQDRGAWNDDLVDEVLIDLSLADD